jgi:hypothetical protein
MISHVFPRSKFFFPRKVSFFVGYILNWIIIPFLLVFKPSKLLNLLEKGLSYKRVFLSVQAKPDCPVSEIGMSSFHIFSPPSQTELTPSLIFTLHFSRATVRVPQVSPLAIPWFLHGILQFLGGFNSPRIRNSDFSFGFEVFIILKVFLMSSSISLLHELIQNSFGTLSLFMS